MMIVAITLDTLGKVMVAFTALRVHHRVLNEHKLDRKVFLELRHEQVIGILGVVLILIAYVMKVYVELS